MSLDVGSNLVGSWKFKKKLSPFVEWLLGCAGIQKQLNSEELLVINCNQTCLQNYGCVCSLASFLCNRYLNTCAVFDLTEFFAFSHYSLSKLIFLKAYSRMHVQVYNWFSAQSKAPFSKIQILLHQTPVQELLQNRIRANGCSKRRPQRKKHQKTFHRKKRLKQPQPLLHRPKMEHHPARGLKTLFKFPSRFIICSINNMGVSNDFF